MTNRHNNWERLMRILARAGMSINLFAAHLGLGRAENLYHMRKGNYGISHDLADRIVNSDPDIDRTWLLSGVGNMLKSEPARRDTIPFYKDEAEVALLDIESSTSDTEYVVPYFTGADAVLRSHSMAMNDTLSVAHDLFLKNISPDEIVQGNEYALLVGGEVLWRRVRFVARDKNKLRLVAHNREEFPDIFIERAAIKRAWRVIARLAILES